MRSKLVTTDPEIMSGEPVFTGTRVPVRNLVDYLSAGTRWTISWRAFPASNAARPWLSSSSPAALCSSGLAFAARQHESAAGPLP